MDKFNTLKLFIYEKKKYFLVFLVILLISLVSFSFIFLSKNKSEEIVAYSDVLETKNDVDNEDKSEEEVKEEYYFVDVKGYVNSPGVYSLLKGKRVVDAINQAGGLKTQADTSLLNLSREIRDEMVIIVYSKDEVNSYNKVEQKEEVKVEICQKEPINDACINDSDKDNFESSTNNENDLKEEINTSPEEEEKSEKININTATLEELMTLSKIGESKALAIIEYRNTKGNFKTIEEIKNVSGIGDTLFNTIKDNITV